jgi:predicted transcriptional regulator
MSQSKKRPKQAEEDLEAAVADMINSPITRANLSFLRPNGPDQPQSEPGGLDPTPTGSDPCASTGTQSPPAHIIETGAVPGGKPTPLGDGPTPMGLEQDTRSGRAQRKPLWQAEGIGTVFEQSRVRRIQNARDALSKVEEQVYTLLWGAPGLHSERYRLIHCSLKRISVNSNINIKTVRELIPRLIDKGFLEIEHAADVHRNIPTLYRVWSDHSVREHQQRRERTHVARTGKGVFYVHPIAISIQTRPLGDEPTPSGLNPMGLDAEYPISGTLLLSLTALVQESLGVVAGEADFTAMVKQCHENATITTGEPATESELLYFTEVKARGIAQSANVRNHLQVLQKAVPTCFLGESFRTFRQTASPPKPLRQDRSSREV